MKTILKTILLMAVLCLAGCSGDDPQSVAFSVHELSAGSDPETFTISVVANCQWTITDDKNNTRTETTTGSGNAEVITRIFTNVDYDDKEYRITITSEDGTSSDVLTIHQDAMTWIEAEKIDMISEEGGTFTIPVKTNDEITSVDTPDWITFTSSRALTSYTYSFTADPNKTGTPRQGTITLKGKELTKSLEVKQDSYTPTGILLQDDISYACRGTIKTKFVMVPEYADASKMEVKSSKGCGISVEDNVLSINLNNYGLFSVVFYANGKEIAGFGGECIPSKPFNCRGSQEAYLGQSDFIQFLYKAKGYVLHSSDENVVSFDEKGKPHAVGYGTSVISVSHPNTDCYEELAINVEPFLIEARIGGIGQKEDGTYDVNFAAQIEGPKGMSCTGFLVTDKEGYVKILNNGHIRDIDLYTKRVTSSAINVNRGGYSDINQAFKGYQFMVEVIIDGTVHQRTAPVDIMKVGF